MIRIFPYGNAIPRAFVYSIMRRVWVVPLVFAALATAYDDYGSARGKVDSIESGRLGPGSRVSITYPEIAAWVSHEAPPGVRNPHVQSTTPGIATGSAMIDFGKVRRSQGYEPGWLMSKLLDGERPVSVTARIRSSGGQATVDVQRVEVSGVALDGATLDFVIKNILLPLYPTAVIGKPFELGDRIERLDVQPAGVGVVIGK